MAFKDRIGLTKEQVRRIALSKMKIVYRDWDVAKGPFWHREPKAGQRRIGLPGRGAVRLARAVEAQ